MALKITSKTRIATSSCDNLINFWDDKNHRNRYPKSAKDIMDILRKYEIVY